MVKSKFLSVQSRTVTRRGFWQI